LSLNTSTYPFLVPKAYFLPSSVFAIQVTSIKGLSFASFFYFTVKFSYFSISENNYSFVINCSSWKSLETLNYSIFLGITS
jgi:hypothetical protein